MVDGFLKSFDEFRNGCDEKAAVYRHKYLPTFHLHVYFLQGQIWIRDDVNRSESDLSPH